MTIFGFVIIRRSRLAELTTLLDGAAEVLRSIPATPTSRVTWYSWLDSVARWLSHWRRL